MTRLLLAALLGSALTAIGCAIYAGDTVAQARRAVVLEHRAITEEEAREMRAECKRLVDLQAVPPQDRGIALPEHDAPQDEPSAAYAPEVGGGVYEASTIVVDTSEAAQETWAALWEGTEGR